MDGSGSNTACASSEPKHVGITIAVERLRNTVNQVERLLVEIDGGVHPPESATKDPTQTPTFSDVINGTSAWLNDLSQKLNDLTVELRNRLF